MKKLKHSLERKDRKGFSFLQHIKRLENKNKKMESENEELKKKIRDKEIGIDALNKHMDTTIKHLNKGMEQERHHLKAIIEELEHRK